MRSEVHMDPEGSRYRGQRRVSSPTHWLLAGGIGFIVAGGAVLFSEIGGRVMPGSEFLLRRGIWALVGFAVFVLVGWLAHRVLPSRPSAWWLVPVFLVSPLVPFGIIVGTIEAHGVLGTPAIGCSWPHLRTERCVGRNWSILQDRLEYVVMEGTMDVQACRGFIRQVPPAPAPAPSGDGGGRNPCAFDRPDAWERASCEEHGIEMFANCFVCLNVSGTSDRYSEVQGFSEDCSRAIVAYGVNIESTSIVACAEGAPDACRPWWSP